MWDFARADIRRLTARERSSIGKVAIVLFHPGLQAVLLYRLSRWFYLHRMPVVSVMLTYVSSVLTGAQISHRATFGKGLAIYHPHGVVVGATAVVGERCSLTHTNMIGQRRGRSDRPVIGDRFYAGSGAKIFGRITIGDDVKVGANAVVTRSLPDAVIAAGVPARIVRPRTPEEIAAEMAD